VKKFGKFTRVKASLRDSTSRALCQGVQYTYRLTFCVRQSLLCMWGIVFRHVGLCFCWYWMTAMYHFVKEQDSQYCRSALFLCVPQYCSAAFSWLIDLVFFLTFLY
jgi:hypothetical protein